MDPIQNHLDYGSGRPRKERSLPQENIRYPEDNKYSQVLHGVATKLGLQTSKQILVFANIESLSRTGACFLKRSTIARISGCTEREFEEILDEFLGAGFVEKTSKFNQPALKLTTHIREMVSLVRRSLPKRHN